MKWLGLLGILPLLGGASLFGGGAHSAAAEPYTWSPGSLPPGFQFVNGFYVDTQSPHLPEGVTSTVQGVRNGTDCGLHLKGSLSPGGPGAAIEQIGVDPATCQFIVERGLPLPGAMTQEGGSQSSAGGQTIPLRPPAGVATARSGVRGLSQWQATEHTFIKYYDPLQITVTSLKDDLTWTYDGSCVDSGTPYRNATWYAIDGWNVNNGNGLGIGDYFNINCSVVEFDSHAHFLNGIFCHLSNTYNDYWYQRTYGYGNGGGSFDEYITDSGGCTNLLGFYSEWGPGL